MNETLYARFVEGRAKGMGDPLLDLLHGAVGASGEAGELLDCIKKSWVYEKPLDMDNIMEEVGDTLFYLQIVCNALGVTLMDMMQMNMNKLKKRYPTGYSNEAALARADKAEDA